MRPLNCKKQVHSKSLVFSMFSIACVIPALMSCSKQDESPQDKMVVCISYFQKLGNYTDKNQGADFGAKFQAAMQAAYKGADFSQLHRTLTATQFAAAGQQAMIGMPSPKADRLTQEGEALAIDQLNKNDPTAAGHMMGSCVKSYLDLSK